MYGHDVTRDYASAYNGCLKWEKWQLAVEFFLANYWQSFLETKGSARYNRYKERANYYLNHACVRLPVIQTADEVEKRAIHHKIPTLLNKLEMMGDPFDCRSDQALCLFLDPSGEKMNFLYLKNPLYQVARVLLSSESLEKALMELDKHVTFSLPPFDVNTRISASVKFLSSHMKTYPRSSLVSPIPSGRAVCPLRVVTEEAKSLGEPLPIGFRLPGQVAE